MSVLTIKFPPEIGFSRRILLNWLFHANLYIINKLTLRLLFRPNTKNLLTPVIV